MQNFWRSVKKPSAFCRQMKRKLVNHSNGHFAERQTRYFGPLQTTTRDQLAGVRLDGVSRALLDDQITFPLRQRLQSFQLAVLSAPLDLIRSLSTHVNQHIIYVQAAIASHVMPMTYAPETGARNRHQKTGVGFWRVCL